MTQKQCLVNIRKPILIQVISIFKKWKLGCKSFKYCLARNCFESSLSLKEIPRHQAAFCNDRKSTCWSCNFSWNVLLRIHRRFPTNTKMHCIYLSSYLMFWQRKYSYWKAFEKQTLRFEWPISGHSVWRCLQIF